KIKLRGSRKTNPVLKETILAARKNPAWNTVAKLLSSSTRNYSSKNLKEIDSQVSAGDTVIIVGKVLSKGELTKKLRICALSVSEKAQEKIRAQKSELVSIQEEIAKNPKAEGIKILK
ncbi:MAG: 50S ribosomal protein L18e, partial [Nanoarchaeota archaeon]|nr:50S ribosomal protein L18e [Nanoarchaeota archaeon]